MYIDGEKCLSIKSEFFCLESKKWLLESKNKNFVHEQLSFMSGIQGSVQVIQERKIEKIYLILFLEILKKLPKITGVYL